MPITNAASLADNQGLFSAELKSGKRPQELTTAFLPATQIAAAGQGKQTKENQLVGLKTITAAEYTSIDISSVAVKQSVPIFKGSSTEDRGSASMERIEAMGGPGVNASPGTTEQSADSPTSTDTEPVIGASPFPGMVEMGNNPLFHHRVAQVAGTQGVAPAENYSKVGGVHASPVGAPETIRGRADLIPVADLTPVGISPASATAVSSTMKSAADTGELFHALEGGAEGSGNAASLHSMRMSARELEVGFQDPQHGWIQVHAGMSGGAIHASVIAETATAGQHLSVGLDSVVRQMGAEGHAVASLTVSVDSGSTGGRQSDHAKQDSFLNSHLEDPNNSIEASQTFSGRDANLWNDDTARPGRGWGGRVSVMV